VRAAPQRRSSGRPAAGLLIATVLGTLAVLLLAPALVLAPAALAAEPPTAETNEVHGFVSATTARFLGTVNPNGAQIAGCQFEYGTSTAYGSSVACESYPEANEAGNSAYVIGADVEGLEPQTEYHYRLLADNGIGGPLDGGDRTFTTAPAPPPQGPCPNEEIPHPSNLPPCWAYELVSPADTNGIDVVAEDPISIDGDHAWIMSVLPLQPDQATGNFDTYAETRTPSGWKAQDLAAGTEPGALSARPALTARDSTATIIERCDLRAAACRGAVTFERVSNLGARTVMASSIPSKNAEPPEAVAGSSDLSRIIVQTYASQTPLLDEDTHTAGLGLYASQLGHLEYLGVDENGNALPCGAALASNPPGVNVGAGFEQDGLSADAKTAIYASPDPEASCPGPIDLYVRRGSQSVDISAPTDGAPDEGATYVGNTRDGDIVYFVTASRLLPSDSDSARDIYSYDLSSHTLERLTDGADIDFGVRPSVQVSANGEYIYFVALNALNGFGAEGAQNLFVYHQGKTEFITNTITGYIFLGQPGRLDRPSPLTPDGRHLVFYSNSPLTAQPTGETFQLFRYDAPAGTLVCVSCRTEGNPTLHEPKLPIAVASNSNRVQSDDGAAVTFRTDEALVPQDINGTRDVYMWREGTLWLVSSGRSQSLVTSALGMSASGNTVFFTSTERLNSEATGEAIKLYAARLDGGFPSAIVKPPCLGSECQGPPAPGPDLPVLGSDSYRAMPTARHRRHRSHHHRHKKRRTRKSHRPRHLGDLK
jgi:hypothetical protein